MAQGRMLELTWPSIRRQAVLKARNTRALHIGPEGPSGLTTKSVVRPAPVADPTRPQTAEFRILSGGSLVQATLPPSVPLLARRNALVGVLGPGTAQSLTSKLWIPASVILRLLGRQPVLYQRILSTEPASCLLSAGTRAAAQVSVLDLDGSIDWVVSHPTTLHAYTGNSLVVRPRTAWAVSAGAPSFAHTVLSGRGTAVLSSPGQLVQLTLDAGETVLVQKQHLGAYSVDTNSSHPRPVSVDLPYTFAETAPPGRWATLNFGNPLVTRIWQTTAQYLRYASATLSSLLQRGSLNTFVRLHGPSVVLVAASHTPARVVRSAPPTAPSPTQETSKAPVEKPASSGIAVNFGKQTF